MIKLIFSFWFLFSTYVNADWQYKSRPDLSPPRLNITTPAEKENTAPGYVFIAPYHGFDHEPQGPIQPGAYIFRDDGDLIWSGVGYFAGWVANFQPGIFNGEPVLRAFQGQLDASHGRMFGNHAILNNRYETVKVVKSTSHHLVSAHEFRIVDEKTVLVETPLAIPIDLSRWGGSTEQNWIVSGGFQGRKIN
jgi:Arylsulfotransferase (ASST)